MSGECKKQLREFDAFANVYRTKFEEAVSHLTLTQHQRQMLSRLVLGDGLSGFIPMCNIADRRRATASAVKAVLALQKRRQGKGGSDLYLATFCLDEGVTPAFDIRVRLIPFIRRIRKIMHDFKLQALCWLEVEPLVLPRHSPRQMMFHIHCVAWRSDGPFQPKVTAKAMSKRRMFTNRLGAAPVDFRRKQLQLPEQIAKLARYLAKMPRRAKRVRTDGTRQWLEGEPGYFQGPLFITTLLALCELQLFDMVFSVGREASIVRRNFKRRQMKRRRESERLGMSIDRQDALGLCQAIRLANPKVGSCSIDL